MRSRLALQLLTFFPVSQSFPFLAPLSHTVLVQQLIGIADTALEFPKTDFPTAISSVDAVLRFTLYISPKKGCFKLLELPGYDSKSYSSRIWSGLYGLHVLFAIRLPERCVLIVLIRLVHIYPTIWWRGPAPSDGGRDKEFFKLSLLFPSAL